MATEENNDRSNIGSEDSFLQLLSSLKSNKQILRKILKHDEISAKRLKIDHDQYKEEVENKISGKAENQNVMDNDVDKLTFNADYVENEEDSSGEDEDSTDDNNLSENDSFSEDDESNGNKLNQSNINDCCRLSSDPFKIHFEQGLDEEIVTEMAKSKHKKSKTESINDNLVSEHYTLPDSVSSLLEAFIVELSKSGKELFEEAGIKENLISNWNHLEKTKKGWLSEVQNNLFRTIAAYKDAFYFNSSFEHWGKNRHLYVLHIVNHVLKSRARVLKNNAKIAQAKKDNKDIHDFRDQGLTRPKVLILVPFKNMCLEIVNDIIKLLFPPGSKSQIMQKKRFFQEYSPDPNEKESKLQRPDDYKAMFKGNIDDCFRIGLSLSKNTIKLFSEFYSADIIIASPLGLRTIIGSEGEKQEFDFLSSIEILIMDQADAFLMQNWEHLTHIFNYLHLFPKQSHETDFSRVRMSTVEGWSKYYRQTLLFSSIQSPEMNSIFNRFCYNYSEKVKYICNGMNGSIEQVVFQIPQIYQNINCTSFIESPDKRFDYFIRKILPDFKNDLFIGTAIFIPSYFDFVRVRNYFKKENLSFIQISEYSKRSNISRSRSTFLEKKKHFLLFTERFHFFYRYRMRGIKHVIFYELPRYPVFYPEILNYMDTSSSTNNPSSLSCTVLYSRFDGFRLEAIVGSERCKQMMTSSKDTHMVITGS